MMDRAIKNRIRQQVLDGNGSEVRKLLLTNDQINLLKVIRKHGEMTAARLSVIEKISVQNASAKLATLHSKGYIGRGTSSAKSGGIEHVYAAYAFL